MKLWLTRRHGGLYMLTAFKPVVARVRGTDHSDAYMRIGEPIGVNGLCPEGVRSLFGVALDELEMIQVQLTGRIVD